MSKAVCPKCGGRLLFEEIGSYGRIHKVRPDGTIINRARTQLYDLDGLESAIVYCLNCGYNKQFCVKRENGEDKIVLKYEVNETTPTMQTMIAFLEHRGWLNVDRVVKDLKD